MTIEKLRSPVGRVVWGHPGKSTIKKDNKTKQPILKDGKPVEQWAFGVAFSKADFSAALYPAMYQEAMTAFPHGVPQNFSWKFTDGDSVDKQGKPYSLRDGYAGCMVLNISTEAFAPPIYKYENGSYRQIASEEIKCGDYVSVNINLKVNVPTDRTFTPGLYVNPNGVELVAYGQEIVTAGGDPNELFGGQQHQLPQGASLVPLSSAPANAAMPGMAAQPVPQGYPAAPQQYAPVQQPQQQLPAPAHDFVQNAGQQPQQYAQPQPAQVPQYAPPAPMGNAPPQPAPYVAPQPQQYAQPGQPQGYPSATPATGYPNQMPGLPPQR